jgi:uncharacterized protein (DUF983 family)
VLIWPAVRRGWRKRCPRCGQGQLFVGRCARRVGSCPHCGLIYERNPGDTWFFMLVGDRVPIALVIVLIYFGVARGHPALFVALFAVITLVVIWTTPNRWGVFIALHYLSRVHWGDSDDRSPDAADQGKHGE